MSDDTMVEVQTRLLRTFEHAGAIWLPTAVDVEHGDGGSATLRAKTTGEGWHNIVASARGDRLIPVSDDLKRAHVMVQIIEDEYADTDINMAHLRALQTLMEAHPLPGAERSALARLIAKALAETK